MNIRYTLNIGKTSPKRRQAGGGKENEMIDMGMTDKQFNGFVRFLLDAIKEAMEEQNETKRNEKLERVIVNLQTTLED